MAEYVFNKPVEIDGELREKINYDLDSITGADVARAIKELAKNNIIVTIAETDQNYHAAIFAIASGIAYEDVKRFGLKDYIKVCNIVRDFFLED